jgi:hypothetical protein
MMIVLFMHFTLQLWFHLYINIRTLFYPYLILYHLLEIRFSLLFSFMIWLGYMHVQMCLYRLNQGCKRSRTSETIIIRTSKSPYTTRTWYIKRGVNVLTKDKKTRIVSSSYIHVCKYALTRKIRKQSTKLYDNLEKV